nr:uncharacterized protein LOC109190215 isoform X1 [Ipomoea trifida]
MDLDGLPSLSGGRNFTPVSPPRANRSQPLSVVKMESACETKPSPATVVKLKPIEATLETFREFGQVIKASPDGEEFGPRDTQLDLTVAFLGHKARLKNIHEAASPEEIQPRCRWSSWPELLVTTIPPGVTDELVCSATITTYFADPPSTSFVVAFIDERDGVTKLQRTT